MSFVLFKIRHESGKKRYFSSFCDKWLSTDKYKDWIVKGEDELSCKCKVCNVSFTVKHNGVKAVNKHLSSDKHKDNFKIQSILKFMPPKYSTEHDKVTATELKTRDYWNLQGARINTNFTASLYLKLKKHNKSPGLPSVQSANRSPD